MDKYYKTRTRKNFFTAFFALIIIISLFSQTAFAKRFFFESEVLYFIKDFFSKNEITLNACDYRDGMIILVKPIATGVGEGRYEAGDIVEIRDGAELCQIAGDKDPLGEAEKTRLLPLYYPKKLTKEQIQELTGPEYEEIQNTKSENKDDNLKFKIEASEKESERKMKIRRQYGIDYTKIFSSIETIKVRNLEGLKRNKLPEIDLSVVINKNSNQAQSAKLRTQNFNLKLKSVFEYFKTNEIQELSEAEQNSVVKIPLSVVFYEKLSQPFKKILSFFIPFVRAGSGTKTICPAGQGCDYTTLNAWEAGEQADLTGQGPAIAQIQGDWSVATDTTAVTIDGWTTTANDYIKIFTTPEARHNGKWDDTKYRLVYISDYSISAIRIYEEFTRIDGLQIKRKAVGSAYPGGIGIIFSNSNSDVHISNNIVRGDVSGITNYAVGIGVHDSSYMTIKIWNNIVYDWVTSNPSYCIRITSSAGIGKTAYIYNNTVYNCSIGFIQGWAGNNNIVILKNNISYNNTDNYSGFFHASSTNNLSGPTQTDAPGSNPRNGVTVQFVDPENGDFHLRAGDSSARGYGANLSNDPYLAFSDDIDGENRPEIGAWDIGADQIIRTVKFNPNSSYKTKINTPITGFGPQDGLVGYWTFDGKDTDWTSATGGTTNDLSGNGNTGTMINMSRSTSPVPGISGQAFGFDGVDDYVNVPDSPSLSSLEGSNQATVSLWLKRLTDPSVSERDSYVARWGTARLFDIGGDINYNLRPFWRYGGSGSGGTGLDHRCSVSLCPIPLGQWTHIVVIYNNPTSFIYLNGQLKSQKDETGGALNTNVSDSLMIASSGLGNYANAVIDEVRIYNRALSAEEVKQLYKLESRKFKIGQ